jgi:N-acetylglucosaminyldiphosphoundecaprenol N-acetyl-beta-D-mannosaminyltransferase
MMLQQEAVRLDTTEAGAGSAISRVNVLGVGVSAINMAMAGEVIQGWIARREHRYACFATVYGIMECRRDASLRRVYNAAGLVTPDGMPLVWLSHRAGFRFVQRVYGPDLMLELCALPGGLHRHFLYGGAEGVPERLAARLTARFPELVVAGAYAPPFRPLSASEDVAVVDRINASGADIVWVGLGAPKQERWMAEHVERLAAPALLGVGAAFDFHAGLKLQAPRWLQRHGLEWLFRLATEPRRLAGRYLVNNPLFVLLVLIQAWGLAHYDLD